MRLADSSLEYLSISIISAASNSAELAVASFSCLTGAPGTPSSNFSCTGYRGAIGAVVITHHKNSRWCSSGTTIISSGTALRFSSILTTSQHVTMPSVSQQPTTATSSLYDATRAHEVRKGDPAILIELSLFGSAQVTVDASQGSTSSPYQHTEALLPAHGSKKHDAQVPIT